MKQEYSIACKTGYASKKFKIWINEFPIETFTHKILEEPIILNNIIHIPDTKICLEYFLPRNISNYAMLGLEYKNTNENCLNIRLFNCVDKKIYVPTVECTDNNFKHCGFLEEYSLAVMQQAQQFFKASKYGIGGELNFSIGAYCDVGSSIASFRLATNILLGLLLNHEEEAILQTINEASIK